MEKAFDWREHCDAATLCAKAELALAQPLLSITDAIAPLSAGGAHDFYSNGDYWWPDPTQPDGLPYIQKDGQSNPDNFMAHRRILWALQHRVAYLTAAFHRTGKAEYAAYAVRQLEHFFVREETKMNPSLCYAQAIPGICTGRGIGIIDTLQLIDITRAAQLLRGEMSPALYTQLQQWFAEYLHWMNTSEYGMAERDWCNNHAIAWCVQAAAFAAFTQNQEMLAFCRSQYQTVFLPTHMNLAGAFTQELARTKPYSYSNFVLDCMVNLCVLLSDETHSLWGVTLPDGRCIEKGIAFLAPYLADKGAWPYPKDVQHFDDFPIAMPFLLFAGVQFDPQYLALWQTLDQHPTAEELNRIQAMAYPLLYCIPTA